MTGALASVDMEHLAGHEAGGFEVEDCFDDVGNLAHAAERVKLAECLMRLGWVHGRLHDARRDGIHANAALGIFDSQRLGGRVESALRQRCEHGGHARKRVLGEARGDLHDMTAALLRLQFA